MPESAQDPNKRFAFPAQSSQKPFVFPQKALPLIGIAGIVLVGLAVLGYFMRSRSLSQPIPSASPIPQSILSEQVPEAVKTESIAFLQESIKPAPPDQVIFSHFGLAHDAASQTYIATWHAPSQQAQDFHAVYNQTQLQRRQVNITLPSTITTLTSDGARLISQQVLIAPAQKFTCLKETPVPAPSGVINVPSLTQSQVICNAFWNTNEYAEAITVIKPQTDKVIKVSYCQQPIANTTALTTCLIEVKP